MCDSRPVSFLQGAIYQLLKYRQIKLAYLLIRSAEACALLDNRLDDKILIAVLDTDGSEFACYCKRRDFFKSADKDSTNQFHRSQCRNCFFNLCNGSNIRMQKCSKCRVVYYCDRQCQRADWPSHQKECCQNITRNDVRDWTKEIVRTLQAFEAEMAIPERGYVGCHDSSDAHQMYPVDKLAHHLNQRPLNCICDISGMVCMVDISMIESLLVQKNMLRFL